MYIIFGEGSNCIAKIEREKREEGWRREDGESADKGSRGGKLIIAFITSMSTTVGPMTIDFHRLSINTHELMKSF